MDHKNYKLQIAVFEKAENMRLGLKLQKKIYKTQSEFIDWALNVLNDSFKEDDTMIPNKDHMILPKISTPPSSNKTTNYTYSNKSSVPDLPK